MKNNLNYFCPANKDQTHYDLPILEKVWLNGKRVKFEVILILKSKPRKENGVVEIEINEKGPFSWPS